MTSDIEGWMHEGELEWLRTQAQKYYRILELGAWKGRSTVALAQGTPGTVWTVDHWKGSDDAEDEANAELAKQGSTRVYRDFIQNTLPYWHKIKLYYGSSAEAAVAYQRLRFDFVFLDADHRYEATKTDIVRWRALTDPGGLISGHDAEYPDVWRAVTEVFSKVGVISTSDPLAPLGESRIWWATN